MNSESWVQQIAAAIHRPGAELAVRFENLGGYKCDVTPIDNHTLSKRIARLTAGILQDMVREVLAPTETVTLLDRLHVGSPVQIRLLPQVDLAAIKNLGGEVSFMFLRLLQCQGGARLLSIPQPSSTMDFTLREPFEPASSVELWPRYAEHGLSEPNCPVCRALPEDIQPAYPGTNACSRCGSVFVE